MTYSKLAEIKMKCLICQEEMKLTADSVGAFSQHRHPNIGFISHSYSKHPTTEDQYIWISSFYEVYKESHTYFVDIFDSAILVDITDSNTRKILAQTTVNRVDYEPNFKSLNEILEFTKTIITFA